VGGFYTDGGYAQPLFGELLPGINFGLGNLDVLLQNIVLLEILASEVTPSFDTLGYSGLSEKPPRCGYSGRTGVYENFKEKLCC
jgi:hypothetical protein